MAISQKNLGSNPTLISVNDLNSLSSTNIVGVDSFKQIFESTQFSFSSRMVNYVESQIFKGVEKTVFYTEVNTEMEVGDKVFILNGNYDSNKFIETNKYDAGSDGYEVLEIDKCRVVLDIDYINEDPYDELTTNVFNIYPVSTFEELEQVTSATGMGSGGKKFSDGGVDIIYYTGPLNQDVSNMFDPLYGGTYSFPYYIGATVSGPTTPGLNVISGNNWININGPFDGGFGGFSTRYIRVEEKNFEHNGDVYKEDFVYKYDSTTSKWEVDLKYIRPLMTKSNFRGGKMLGSWNSGVYGRSETILEWSEPTALWGGGVLYNSNWNTGEINSLETEVDSYLCQLDSNGLPFEEIITTNNKGYGYNYILSSEVKGGVINNGNVIKTVVGDVNGDNMVKEYIENVTSPTASVDSITASVDINGGLFLNSTIDYSILNKSDINSSRVTNSLIGESKSINSYIDSSVFKDSIYVTDDIIRILSIDKDEFGTQPTVTGTQSATVRYRLGITEESYNRFKIGDYFYLKGIVFTNTSFPLNFFHIKYQLSTWLERFEYVDSSSPTTLSYVDIKVSSTLATDSDKYYIDIMFEKKDSNLYPELINMYPDLINIDIANSYVLDSNYESGIFETSDWNSGFNISPKKNSISNVNGDGKYNLSIISNQVNINNTFVDKEIDEIVFLNSVDYIGAFNKETRLPDTYYVDTNSRLEPTPNTGVISSLGTYSVFSTGTGLNRNGYLHKLKFSGSKIKSGIFRRSYFNNCLIENENYKSTDKDFKDIGNIRRLLVSESVFSKTNNFLSSATYLNSLIHKREDKFVDGIIYNSIWDGGIFDKGIFRESTWVDGEFNGGEFYNNKTFDDNPTITLPDVNSDRVSSFYKSGSFPNNRYSWQDGIFNGGLFNKSDWEDGIFNDGKFVDSKFYGGDIKGGIIGDLKVDYTRTRIYNADIENTKVENGYLYAEDPSYYGLNDSIINWKDGVFEKGVFGSKPINNVKCYDLEIPGIITKSKDKDYIYISIGTDSIRVDPISDPNLKNLITPNPLILPFTQLLDVIKSTSDSLGNPIEATSGYVVKYRKDKGGGIFPLGSLNWEIIDTTNSIVDIYMDIDDNLYVCYLSKVEKYNVNKSLIWTIENNISNGAIDGDGDFIFVSGGSNAGGYIEKWSNTGDFIWRTDTISDINTNCRIRNHETDLFVLFDTVVSDKYIYKLNKTNGIIIKNGSDDHIFKLNPDVNDFIYDPIDDQLVIVGDDLYIVDNKIYSVSPPISYTSIGYGVNEICYNIEYKNGNMYTISYIETSPGFFNNQLILSKLTINYTNPSFSYKSLLLQDTKNVTTQNKLFKMGINSSGVGYSELELYDPISSSGDTSIGPNTFDVDYLTTTTFDIKNITFPVGSISFWYSFRNTQSSLNPLTPQPPLSFTLTKDNTLQLVPTLPSTVEPIFGKTYSRTDNGITRYTWASNNDWEYFEFPMPASIPTGQGEDYRLTLNMNNYTIKIDQFCVNSKTGDMRSIWNNGKFNGGEFVDKAKWIDGKFNGGKFLSTYGSEYHGIEQYTGLTQSIGPTQSMDFSWENGEFNGGEFGNSSTGDNSTWFNGRFNGGKFNGKLWNNGIFTNGEFNGGIETNILDPDNTSSYLSVYNYTSTRGIWRDGFVTTKVDRFIKDSKLYTDLNKVGKINPLVSMENVVWESGTFSHESGTMDNSIWLDGTFESGTFNNSVFNPWFVDRFNTSDTCIWIGGFFVGGYFKYSKWMGGLFNTGNALGMIWEGGISNYMNAYNILWKGGVWKNGNWFGSDFIYNGSISKLEHKSIMDRINSEYGVDEYHIWNVFDDKTLSNTHISTGTASNDII